MTSALGLLRQIRSRKNQSETGSLESSPAPCAMPRQTGLLLVASPPEAVLLKQPRRIGRDLWLARDEEIAAEIEEEMAHTGKRVPVILFAEIEPLFEKSDAMIAAVLNVLSEIPGTRLYS